LRYDKKESGHSFSVGDLVWFYVPAVTPGRTKKFSCLWWGPYTVIDKTGVVNYRIQLLGSTKTLLVHRNRLKTCFSRSQWKSVIGTKKNELHDKQTIPPATKTAAVETSKSSYAEVAAATPTDSPPAGYTSTDDI